MDHCASRLNEILTRLSVDHRPTLEALRGLRNGLIYGVKVRAPHAFVMAMLFGRGTLLKRLHGILLATRMHAVNLGRYVFGYKLVMSALRTLWGRGEYQSWHPLIAAGLLGYLVFGEEGGVNTQINLYLLSRVIYALARLSVERGLIRLPPSVGQSSSLFPWFAAAVWGVGLWLYENHPSTLQKSLQSSMQYLYRDSEHWTGVREFMFG